MRIILIAALTLSSSAWPCSLGPCPALTPVYPQNFSSAPLPTNVQLVVSTAAQANELPQLFAIELADGGSPDGGVRFTAELVGLHSFCGSLNRIVFSEELAPASKYRLRPRVDGGSFPGGWARDLEFVTGGGPDLTPPAAPSTPTEVVRPFDAFCSSCGPSTPLLIEEFSNDAEGPLWYVPVSVNFRTPGGVDRISAAIACRSGGIGVAPGEQPMEVFAIDLAGNRSPTSTFTVQPACVGEDPCSDVFGVDAGESGHPLGGDPQGCGCSTANGVTLLAALGLLLLRAGTRRSSC